MEAAHGGVQGLGGKVGAHYDPFGLLFVRLARHRRVGFELELDGPLVAA
jgi:hypothetical protein